MMPLLGNQSQKGKSFVNPFFKQGIGRRTGVVIKTDVRKDSDGFEVFDDYFSDSELENSELSFALNKENISVHNGGHGQRKGKRKSQDKIKRSSPLRPMKSFSPMVSSGKSSIDASNHTQKATDTVSKDAAVKDDEEPSLASRVTETVEDEDIKSREESCDVVQHHETEPGDADEEVADKMLEVVDATSEEKKNSDNEQHPGEEKVDESENRKQTVLKTLNDENKISVSPSQTQIFPLTKKRLSFSCAEKASTSPEPLLQNKPISDSEEKDKDTGEVYEDKETSNLDALHRASGAAAFSFRFSELLSSTKNPENSQCTESDDADIVIVSEGSEKSFFDKSKGRKSGAHYRKESNTKKKVKTDSRKQKSGRRTLDVDKPERRQVSMEEMKDSALNKSKLIVNRNVSVAVVEVHAPMNLLDDEEELSSSASETIKDDGVINVGDETDDVVKIQYKLVDQPNDEIKKRENETLLKMSAKVNRKQRNEGEDGNLNVSNTGRRNEIKTTKRKMNLKGADSKDLSEEKQVIEEEDEGASIPHKSQHDEDQVISAVAGKRRSKRLMGQHNSDVSMIVKDGRTEDEQELQGGIEVNVEQDPQEGTQELVASSQSSGDNSQVDRPTRRGRSRKTKMAKTDKGIDEAKTRIPIPRKTKGNTTVQSKKENAEDGPVGRHEVEMQSDGNVPITGQKRTKVGKLRSQSDSEDHFTKDNTGTDESQSSKGQASSEDISNQEADGTITNRGKRGKWSTREASLSDERTSNGLNPKRRRTSTRANKKSSVAKSHDDSEDHPTKEDTAKHGSQSSKGQASSEDISNQETDGTVMNRSKRAKRSTSESSLSNDGARDLNRKKRRASTRTDKISSVAKHHSDSEHRFTQGDTGKDENQSNKEEVSSGDMSNPETDGTIMNRSKRDKSSTSESISNDGNSSLNEKKRRASTRTKKKSFVSSVMEPETVHIEGSENVPSSSSDEASNVAYGRMFTLPVVEEKSEIVEEDKGDANSDDSHQMSRESTELHSTYSKVKRGDGRGNVERMSVVKKTLDYLEGESPERLEPGKTTDAAVDGSLGEEVTEVRDASSNKDKAEKTTPAAPEKTTNSQTERGLCSPLSILKSSKVIKRHRRNMKKKKFRFSIQEVPLSKAWIIPPTKENESNRRSKRNRVRPLEFWRNERAIYERRKSGGFALKGICSPEIEEPYLRKKKTKKRKSKGKYTIPITPKNLSLHVQAPEEAMTGCSDPVPVVNPETQREVLVDVVRTPSSSLYVGPSGGAPNETDNILVAKQLVQPAFNAGTLLIRPESEKGLQISQRDTMVFYIVRGKLAVTIHKTTQVLESGSFFFVPPGNVYNISNLRKDEAKVLFFQHKGPPVDGFSP